MPPAPDPGPVSSPVVGPPMASHNPSPKIAKKSTECFQPLTRPSRQFCPKTEMSCCYPETEGWIAAFRPAAPPNVPFGRIVQKEPPCCELRYRMKNDVTRSTATRPLPLRPVVPGDAYCKNHPPDASPDFDPFSQLTETEQLKYATMNNLTHTKNMRLRLLTPGPWPPAPGPGFSAQRPPAPKPDIRFL